MERRLGPLGEPYREGAAGRAARAAKALTAAGGLLMAACAAGAARARPPGGAHARGRDGDALVGLQGGLPERGGPEVRRRSRSERGARRGAEPSVIGPLGRPRGVVGAARR